MAKYRIGVLYDVWWVEDEEPAPPEPKSKRKAPRKKEKEVHQEVYEALKEAGHNPIYSVIEGDDETLHELAGVKADLFFNLTESYAGDDTKDMNIAAYLDLLGRRYTGAGPYGLYLAQDKALAKKVFTFHGIRTPSFASSYRGRIDHVEELDFPLIVKPSSEDSSIGIDAGSVVTSVKEMMDRIALLHERFDCPALIEEFIEGREIYVGILGDARPEALPPVEMDLSKLPKGMPRIAGTEVKWEKGTEAYDSTRSAVARNLPEDLARRIRETALAAYNALGLRDYGRIDLRVTPKGDIYVIEANPNPWLAPEAELAMAAAAAGRDYPKLIGEIADRALSRYS